jgi:uncharacterized membrane protein YhaH (DUF805 family)
MNFLANLHMHLTNLANFNGRESRAQFWPWVGVLIASAMIVNMLIMSQLVMPVMLTAELMEDITGGMAGYTIAMACISGVTVALLASAVTRRLHDAGKPFWIGLLPLPFLVFGLFWFMRIISTMFVADEMGSEYMSSFMLGFFNNLVYMGTLVFLVVCLAQGSEPGENRHGPQPGSA